MSGQEASRSISQPEVFQVINSTFRNTWCKPCTIPSSPKSCGQFRFCRNLKNAGFVEGCIVIKPRIFINQNLHRKPVLMDDVPNSAPRATASQHTGQSHEHSPEPPVLRNLLLPPAAHKCSTLRLLRKHLQRQIFICSV